MTDHNCQLCVIFDLRVSMLRSGLFGHVQRAAGGVGGELRCILALYGGYARGVCAGVVDPHVVGEDICAFWKMVYENARLGGAVLAVESKAFGIQMSR